MFKIIQSYSINKVDESKLSFGFNSQSLNPQPVNPPSPTENLVLKDKDGKVLYDSNNKRLLVRG